MKSIIMYIALAIFLMSLSGIAMAAVFVYYPLTIKSSPVPPPLIYQSVSYPLVTDTLDSSHTSANITISLNKELHIYDYNLSAGYVAARNINNLALSRGQSFNVSWTAYITNYTDPNNASVVLQEITYTCGGTYNWASFYYYGGNSVSAGGTTYNLDMSIPHLYNITIYEPSKNKITISYYVDNVLVATASNNCNNPTIVSVEAGRYDVRNEYDLYIDNAWIFYLKGNVYTVYTDDFEDGVDNFFVNSYSNPSGSGNVGKEVVYAFCGKVLGIQNVDSSSNYNFYLSLNSVQASNPSSIYKTWIWTGNDTQKSSAISIYSSSVLQSTTSQLIVWPNEEKFIYVNYTAPLSFSGNVAISLSLIYGIPGSDAVSVYYPLKITIG